MTETRGRHRVKITGPDKPLFPNGITKADLARYYERVAEPMLHHIAGRPLNLERYPDGIEGERIFQQHASPYFPEWIRRVEVPARNKPVQHVVADSPDTLVYLAGQACITLHRWLSRRDRLDRPDRLVFDLDPSEDKPAQIRRAAVLIGALLTELELVAWVMTSGSRGYHVVVALQRRHNFDEVREFAGGVAEVAVSREPRLFTTEQRKAKRDGRILIDVMRNAYAHTAVAPYSVRPLPKAPVATPLHWDELEDGATTSQRWTLSSVPERLVGNGDPWRRIDDSASSLSNARKLLERARAA